MRSLYRIAAVCSLAIVATIPVALYAFITWPPPVQVEDWFAFIQNNRLAAVLNLDVLLLLDQLLFVPIILALFVTLRRTNESLMLLGTVGGLIGATLLIVSREATFTLPTLSDQYAAATTDAQRAIMLAAGQVLLATFNGTAFSVGYAVLGVSGLLVTWVMLGSGIFNRLTAGAGVTMYLLAVVPPTVGTIGVMLSLVSLAPLVVFQILLAWRFWQLAGSPVDGAPEMRVRRVLVHAGQRS